MQRDVLGLQALHEAPRDLQRSIFALERAELFLDPSRILSGELLAAAPCEVAQLLEQIVPMAEEVGAVVDQVAASELGLERLTAALEHSDELREVVVAELALEALGLDEQEVERVMARVDAAAQELGELRHQHGAPKSGGSLLMAADLTGWLSEPSDICS